MKEFYAKRDEDFAIWFAGAKVLLEKGLLSPKEIFDHAYTLGALQEVKAEK